MSGPPKKPTAWRRADGNRGKRAWNRAEPAPPEGAPDCPDHLSEEARAEWHRLVVTLRLWDTTTGAALGAALRGHESDVNSVTFSPPNSSRIVSGGSDGTLRLWDATSGAALGEPLRGHEDEVLSVAFSPDGRRIVSGGSDGTLRLWDATTGTELSRPLRPNRNVVDSELSSIDGVISVAFSPDGRRIVAGGTDGAVRLWGNLPTGNILQVACRYLPHVEGRIEPSTEGLADVVGFEGLTLPEDCDTYDPVLPPELLR